MNLACKSCGRLFEPSDEQTHFLRKMSVAGSAFAMVKCPNCGLSFGVDPEHLNDSIQNDSLAWRTLLSGVQGFVTLVDEQDDSFYGCGETGAIWKSKEFLFRDIDRIIERYPHRSMFYVKSSGGWIPAKDEPDLFNQLIGLEDMEELNSYLRE